MKTCKTATTIRHLVLAVVLVCMWQFGLTQAAAAVGLTVSPAAISNTYSGMVTVQITGLTNGETVTMQRYLDVDGNGTVDSADWLTLQVQLTDGFVPKIGGATNYAAPYDLTGTNGAITAQLNYCGPWDIDRFCGRHLFRVSGPSGSATAMLSVMNFPYPQLVRGRVTASGTNVPYASVVVFGPYGEPVAGTIADSAGNYTNRLPIGQYILLAIKPGYVGDFAGAPSVTLTTGATVVTNVSLTPASRLISGRIVDAGNTNIGLPGVFVFFGSSADQVTVTATDTNGLATASVTPGYWMIEPDNIALARLGYVDWDEDKLPVLDTTTGDVTGQILPVPKANALLYGSIRTLSGQPLAGVSFWGWSEGEYVAGAVSDTNGIFAAPVLGGMSWWFEVDDPDENPALANYIVTRGTNQYVSVGQAIKLDFLAVPATGTISGRVTDDVGEAIADLGVWAWAVIGTNEFDAYTETDSDGYFRFPVADGMWHVGLDCWDLQNRGYQCPSEQTVTIPPTNAVVNFTVYQIAPLEITTASLPSGQVGNYYIAWLSAGGGVQPYTWSIVSGSLPTGLSLDGWSGQIYGTPTTTGTFNFRVRVTDWRSSTAERNLSIYIAAPPPPLQIITTTLPAGAVGQYYAAQVEATNGQPPYLWVMDWGSLPPGLSLYNNGAITGVPLTNGLFSFGVKVIDWQYNTATRSLTITVSLPPLVAPVLEQVRLTPDGRFTFEFNTVVGRNYTVLCSTNLVDWVPVLSFQGTGGRVIYTEPGQPVQNRFYRVRVE